MTMTPSEVERRRKNEETFAEANKGIHDVATELEIDPVPFLCECSATNCIELIQLSLDDYRRVRERGGFLVRPGHDDPHVEAVVEEHETFQIVEKFR